LLESHSADLGVWGISARHLELKIEAPENKSSG